MNREFKIVKLYFKEPLALMSEKKDEFMHEVLTLPSDTIKAALISVLGQAGAERDEIRRLNEDLIVSSAYPFYKDILFFPKPSAPVPLDTEDSPKKQKTIKKITFIQQSLFEKLINGEKVFFLEKENLLHGGKFLVEKEAKDEFEWRLPGQELAPDRDKEYKLYAVQTLGRVSLGNLLILGGGEKGSPYYVSRTYFRHGGGLFFVYDTGEEELFRKALDIWQNEGTGADRRLGNGRFGYELDTLTLRVPEMPDKQMILSKFVPRPEEINQGLLEEASYSLSIRGGYVAGTPVEAYSHWLKQNIAMMDEASVFNPKVKAEGKNVVVSNLKLEEILGHKVYRDGRIISLPIKTLKS